MTLSLQLNAAQTLLLAVPVLFLGTWVTRRIRFLDHYRIPEAISGGLLAALLLSLLRLAGVQFTMDIVLRDALLLAFFTTLGLSVQLSLLKRGGRPFLLLTLAAGVAVFLQDLLGVALAWAAGLDPRYGLVTGSVALAGGIGTAVAWGEPLSKAGLAAATETGIAMATLGLIAGGLLGGPVASLLIRRHGLQPSAESHEGGLSGMAVEEEASGSITVAQVLQATLVLSLAVTVGMFLARLGNSAGAPLPTFVYCLLTGVMLSTLFRGFFSGRDPWPGDGVVLALTNQVSLSLFVVISLLGIDFVLLGSYLLHMAGMLVAQTLLMLFVLVPICFRFMNRNYDAAVCSAGLVGLGLGATPTALVNMQAVTARHGPSPLAFIIVPLVGAVTIDLINTVVLSGFLLVLPGGQ